jgi:hypothetical protein
MNAKPTNQNDCPSSSKLGTPALLYLRQFQKAALIAGCVVIGLASLRPVAAQSTNAPAVTDYSSFRLITERNIFDPNRYAHTSRSVRRTANNNRAPAFSLAGTMTYQSGMLAFFDGTDPDYRRVLSQNGIIAGYRVMEITLHGVRLESAGKTNVMKVGMQMRQESKGEWQLSDASDLPAIPTESTNSAISATDETPEATRASGSDSEPNDILKKLMQQREQELK